MLFAIPLFIYIVFLVLSHKNKHDTEVQFVSIKNHKVFYDIHILKNIYFYLFCIKIACYYVCLLILFLIILPTFISAFWVWNCTWALGSWVRCEWLFSELFEASRSIAEILPLIIIVSFWIWIPIWILISTKYCKKYYMSVREVIWSFLLFVFPVTAILIFVLMIYHFFTLINKQER